MPSDLLQTYNRNPVSFFRGKGSYLFTESGDSYLDLGSGIAVNSLGHSHPKLIKALNVQSKLLWHTSNLYQIAAQDRLASILVKNSFAEKVFFTNSGSESVECAIKMARKFGHSQNSNKNRIITFEGSFHGRTFGSISASASEKLINGFGPVLDGFDLANFGDFNSVERLISDKTCAILVEPIQGEGGIRTAEHGFLENLRKICDKNDLLLIFDEVQSGIGRTGKLFAFEHSGVIPDIVAVAKGIGGGFPLGCCLSTDKAAAAMSIGSHGSTFGGNPLACSVGIAVLDEIFSENFLDNVVTTAAFFRGELQRLVDAYPSTYDSVRGVGLMLGIKCTAKNDLIVKLAFQEKLILVPGGENTVRILPALNIPISVVKKGLESLQRIAQRLEAM